MGVIEDIRKVMQDFLAPELRAIQVEIKNLGERLDKMELHNETRHQELIRNMNLEGRIKHLEAERLEHREGAR